MALLDADFDNIRAAWQWAVEHQDYANLALALDGFYHFCTIRGYVPDGIVLIQQAAEPLQGTISTDAYLANQHLLGEMLACLGALYADSDESEKAIPILEQSLTYIREPRRRAFVLGRLGFAISYRGDEPLADQWLTESLAISRECDDLPGQAYALHRLCSIKEGRGNYLSSCVFGRESLALYREVGRPDRIAHILSDLAVVESFLGEYTRAMSRFEEALSLCRTLGYRNGEAWALTNLGALALYPGANLEKATDLIREALAGFQSTGHVGASSMTMADLAMVLAERGAYEQALQYANEGVALARARQQIYVLSFNLAGLGGVQVESQDLNNAKHSLLESLALAMTVKRINLVLQNIYHLAEIIFQENQSQNAAAIAAQCRAVEWLEFIQHHSSTWHYYQQKAASLQVELAAVLPAQEVAAAQAKGKMLTLSEVVDNILNQT